MKDFSRSFGLFAAGFFTCVVFLLGGVTLFYFVSVKPTVDRFANQPLQKPIFPADHRPAVLDGSWTRSDGTKLNLAELKGKVVVLNVWATWCGPCLAELPTLSKLASHYAAADDVKVICVTKETVSLVANKLKTSDALSIAYSTDGAKLPGVYSTQTIPATFLIDKGGQIVFEHLGSADWACPEVIAHIDRLREESRTKQ